MNDNLLRAAQRLADDTAATTSQRAIFDAVFDSLHERIACAGIGFSGLNCVRIPLSVYRACGGESSDVVHLIESLIIFFVGVDLWDDVMDGDLSESLAAFQPHELELIAIALISGSALQGLLAIPTLPPTRERLIQVYASACTQIAAGQQIDISLIKSTTTDLAAAEAAVWGKSGAVMGMYAELAATLAGADTEIAGQIGASGKAYGAALQLRNDCEDLLSSRWSRDLARGIRTLPLLLYIDRLPQPSRAAFYDLLDRAQHDPEAQQDVRLAVNQTGIPNACAFTIATWCERAVKLLTGLDLSEPYGSMLVEHIRRTASRA